MLENSIRQIRSFFLCSSAYAYVENSMCSFAGVLTCLCLCYAYACAYAYAYAYAQVRTA